MLQIQQSKLIQNITKTEVVIQNSQYSAVEVYTLYPLLNKKREISKVQNYMKIKTIKQKCYVVSLDAIRLPHHPAAH